MEPNAQVSDSDSGSPPSDGEKKVALDATELDNLARRSSSPDPDEGLSDAEKARIVRCP